MKRLRLLRWSGTVLTPRTRPSSAIYSSPSWVCRRCQATTATSKDSSSLTDNPTDTYSESTLQKLPSPPVLASRASAKLSALHSRLALPKSLPLETLARALVDASADSSARFNNKSFAVLGNDLLAYYTSEYIIAQYPRLPLAVVFAAMYAYVGPKALTAITREWGVEYAAHPGGEVDPGLLQFTRIPPEPVPTKEPLKENLVKTSFDDGSSQNYRRGMSSRSVYSDEFGDIKSPSQPDAQVGVTAEKACTNFIRGLVGALYLHAGRPTAKKFYRHHFMSRELNMASLFQFRHPTRDLSRLCAREGFQSPIARIISETGRRSRHPVFIVGVYSGNDKLGEGAGASLDEARTRAAVAALKGWYLYSPLEFRLPSEMEEEGAREWTPIVVDSGDIVV